MVVVPHPANELRVKRGGGSGRRLFVNIEEIPALADTLSTQLATVATAQLAVAKSFGMEHAVLKVVLREEALAKSHRPLQLLEHQGRNRVIGGLEFGSLLVDVTSSSVVSTIETMAEHERPSIAADVSTIFTILPLTTQDIAPDLAELVDAAVRLTLFDYLDETRNESARQSVEALLSELEISAERRQNFYACRGISEARLNRLLTHPAIFSLSPDSLVTNPLAPMSSTQAAAVPLPDPNRDYAVVGLLDTGVHASITTLQPWIAGQSNKVIGISAGPEDYAHAAQIGGLLAAARHFNPAAGDIPAKSVKFFDARVYSRVEGTTGADLIARIGDLLVEHPEIKVWNVSLGKPFPHSGSKFSDLATDLDELAQRHQVLFVLAAGNYTAAPQRSWPPQPLSQLRGLDIICSPADSALGLTVGALATYDHAQAAVKAGEPAGYSRRGPGPGALPKPEVTMSGGNGSAAHPLQAFGGIRTLDASGNEAATMGTSFAAPLVAGVAARTWQAIADQGTHEPTPELVKALMIHSAALHSSPREEPAHLRYYGFGTPRDVSDVLLCDDGTFTTVHDVMVPPGREIHHDFAMPACLMLDGVFKGEIVITLAYVPVLDRQFGEEYCRTNIQVKLGTLDLNTDTAKLEFSGRAPPDPKWGAEAGEKALIEHGFKWSPIKVYRNKFPYGIEAKQWQLRFDLLLRAGQVTPEPQRAVAVVSVRGLEPGLPVYADGIQALNSANVQVQSLVSTLVVTN